MFVNEAIKNGFIDHDAMATAAAVKAFDETLLEQPNLPASGLELWPNSDPSSNPVYSFNQVGLNAWSRPPFRVPKNYAGKEATPFEYWLTAVLSSNIECLVVAGHHSQRAERDDVWPLFWGAQGNIGPYTAFLPFITQEGKPMLIVKGYSAAGSVRVLAGPFDMSTALKSCHLILIMGCNGVSEYAKKWQSWVKAASGASPVVLGWYGSQSMPRDNQSESFADRFWRNLAAGAGGEKSLAKVCAGPAKAVLDAWQHANSEAFKKSKCQSPLWYAKKGAIVKDCPSRRRIIPTDRGLGAIDPTGQMWAIKKEDGALEKVY
ncbi:MAG: hypothetical protein U1F34_03695 [Gammaproteobacteria bacterium]